MVSIYGKENWDQTLAADVGGTDPDINKMANLL